MRECPACFGCYDDSVNVCPVEGRQTFNSLPGDVALDGRYVLERRLGEGGMGVVYKAHHKFLKTTRAIKVIKPELVGNDPSFATRFQQEAMAAAAIGHPNIISVPDYGFLGGEIPFLVMEFVEGASLQDLMASEGRFTPEAALDYMRVIASGVGAAHAHGIVHRDLKPLNIMIHRKGSLQEQIRILDFGLAKIKSADLFGSFVGAKTTGIIGSPYYMAPEQWSDDEPDKRCDIYSLGIILYQMLSGEVPFKGSSIPAVMKKHLMTAPPPLAVSGSGISQKLEKVVYHALEKDPLLRTGSAEELIAELEQAVAGSAAGKSRAKPRGRAKTKSTATRSKETEVARTTAEQMRVRPEVKDVARSTADQKEALKIEQSSETDPLDADLVLDDSNATETIVNLAPVLQEDEPIVEIEELPQLEVQAPPIEVEAPQSIPELERPDEVDHSAISNSQPRLDALRKATEAARRRAEERAIEESGNLALPVRTSSMPPRTVPVLTQPAKVEQVGGIGPVVRKPLVIAIGVALLVTIVGALVIAQLWTSPEPHPATPGAVVVAPPQRDMVLIKGGRFVMGSDSAGEEQKGAHSESVSSFYMDKTEVTNAEYAAFVKATGYRVPTNEVAKVDWWKSWNGTEPPAGRERWPVSNVSVKDAEAFAQWLSNRDGVKYQLPTEAQWEFAARNGSDESLFPWGNSWDGARANLNGKSSPAPVGSFPGGATPTGLMDMIGNVWEWTSSKASFYDARPIKPEYATAHVWRGGSFADRINTNFINATDRGWFESEKFPSIGFRLVREAQ